MKKTLIVIIFLLTAVILCGCRAAGDYAAITTDQTPATQDTTLSLETSTEKEAAITTVPFVSEAVDPRGFDEMTMEEIESKLGFGYRLPPEGEYAGRIVCTCSEEPDGKGILTLIYILDEDPGRMVYITKYRDEGADAYDEWDQFKEAGTETVSGVEVRFRDISDIPGHRAIAFWKQDGFQYILNCAPSAPDADIMTILPLFIEEPGAIDPAETICAEPHATPEMSMEELEAKLGYGYQLPDESTYSGTIISKFDDSLGEDGGILLQYELEDTSYVFAAKYPDLGTDAYDEWWTDYAERGSEIVNGVEVRFRGDSTRPDYRGIAYWKQNGFQYTLYCETSPFTDIMSILPLFIEVE